MAVLTDKQILRTLYESGYNVAEVARQLGCGPTRVNSAANRRAVVIRNERHEREFQERKHRLLADLSRLEIVR